MDNTYSPSIEQIKAKIAQACPDLGKDAVKNQYENKITWEWQRAFAEIMQQLHFMAAELDVHETRLKALEKPAANQRRFLSKDGKWGYIHSDNTVHPHSEDC